MFFKQLTEKFGTKEIELRITSEMIYAKTRKLKVVWTYEVGDLDLQLCKPIVPCPPKKRRANKRRA
jgi:hypothetical protein